MRVLIFNLLEWVFIYLLWILRVAVLPVNSMYQTWHVIYLYTDSSVKHT